MRDTKKTPIYLRWWFILLMVAIAFIVLVNVSQIYHRQLRAAGHIFYEEGLWVTPGKAVTYCWIIEVKEPTEVEAYMTGRNILWLYKLAPETPRIRCLSPTYYEERGAELMLWKDGAFEEVRLQLSPGEYMLIIITKKDIPWSYAFTVGLRKIA